MRNYDHHEIRAEFEDVKSRYDTHGDEEGQLEILLGDCNDEKYRIDDMSTEGFKIIESLEREIRAFIEENAPKETRQMQWNPDAELNRMFPDRGDDDFDEESMSYDSVFGSD